ncbi:MAG: SLC13 family permease [Chloroflexota bacterium]
MIGLSRERLRRPIILAVAVVAGLAVALTSPPTGLSAAAMRAVGLLVWAIICWAGDALSDYVVALIMGIGWVALRIVPFDLAFACFSSSSWWMMVGALGIGVAVAESGLLRRVALLALRALPPTYSGQTGGLILAGLLFSPALPTVTGKTAVAAPFVLGMAKAMKLENRSRHTTGLFMSMFTGFGLMGPLFLTGTVTNFVILALLPPATRAGISWGSWFFTYLPTMLIILILSWLAILITCRPRRVEPLPRGYVAEQLASLGPIRGKELTTLLTLAVTVLLWIVGRWAGLDGAIVAMAALAFLSATGVIDRAAFQAKISWTGLIFVGITLNLAEVLPALEIDVWLGRTVAPLFAPLVDRPALFFAVLMAAVFVVRQVLISDFAVVTLMMLVLGPVAGTAGISPWAIGIATHLIVQSVWILPFQNDAYLVSHRAASDLLADQPRAALLSVLICAGSVVSVVMSLPWWRHLGLLAR